METIHEIIKESVSGGFWRFIGVWLMTLAIFGIVCRAIVIIVVAILRHYTIRKHGYPPEHCNADGDLQSKNDSE